MSGQQCEIVVCGFKEHKEEKERRVRATFGNTASDYDGPVKQPHS
jgi:hypothetical protein